MTALARPPVPGWDPPTDDDLREILASTRTVAVVGASSDPDRASNQVMRHLLEHTNWQLLPVHPTETEVLGLPAHPTLEDLPITPDVVDVFRRADALPDVARSTVAIGAKVFWAQQDLWSAEAAGIALDGGLWVVMDRCLKVEHQRLA